MSQNQVFNLFPWVDRGCLPWVPVFSAAVKNPHALVSQIPQPGRNSKIRKIHEKKSIRSGRNRSCPNPRHSHPSLVVLRIITCPICTSLPGGGATNSAQQYARSRDELGTGSPQFTLEEVEPGDWSAIEKPRRTHQSAPTTL
jgi:hypothetical protein